MSEKERLGDRIKRIRTERGLGLRETAGKIGISATFLSRVESNSEKAAPSEDVLKKLAKVLDDDIDILMHLAERVPQDVAAVIKNDPGMPAFLRTAKQHQLSGDDLMKLLAEKQKGNAVGAGADRGRGGAMTSWRAIYERMFEKGPDSFSRSERETIRAATEEAWNAGVASLRSRLAEAEARPCCLSLYRAAGGQTSGGDCPRCGAGAPRGGKG